MKMCAQFLFILKCRFNLPQTTAEVEEAIKKGLPAERPVSSSDSARPDHPCLPSLSN